MGGWDVGRCRGVGVGRGGGPGGGGGWCPGEGRGGGWGLGGCSRVYASGTLKTGCMMRDEF